MKIQMAQTLGPDRRPGARDEEAWDVFTATLLLIHIGIIYSKTLHHGTITYLVRRCETLDLITSKKGEQLMTARSVDAIVLGAGFAGLMTAWRLLNKNFKVLVVEPEPGLTHQSYYPGINGSRAWISNRYKEFIEEIKPKILEQDDSGSWIDPLELIIRLAYRVYVAGGRIVVDSVVEPFYKIYDDRIIVIGAVIKSLENESGTDREYVLARGIIDASHNALIPTNLVDRLKTGIIIQGNGPIIPGSSDVIDKTTWIFPGIIVAGLAAAQTNGANLPFPDIGPLLASGVKAAELFIEGYPENPVDELFFPGVI